MLECRVFEKPFIGAVHVYQMKRQKEQKAMIDGLAKGDEIVTAGGVVGKITKVSDGYVTVEVAQGTEIIMQKAAVTLLLPKGTIKAL